MMAWHARVEAFAESIAGFAPDDAAQHWLVLVDEWEALPKTSEDEDAFRSPGSFFALLSVLPPPAAWSALEKLVATRPLEGDAAIMNRVLRVLVAALRRNYAALHENE